MTMCSRSCFQPLALHQRQQDRDRERKRHESETGGWRRARACVTGHLACVRRQMFLVWRGRGERTRALLRLLLQSPPGMNKQMCREDALACWDSQSSCSVSLLIFSLLLSTDQHHHLLFLCSSGLTSPQEWLILISQAPLLTVFSYLFS